MTAMTTEASELKNDREQLRLLSIFHYVVGGAVMLFSCFFLIHVGIGMALMLGWIPANKGEGPLPQMFVGGLMFLAGCAALLCGWTFGLLTIYSGRCLARQKWRMFSLVIAALNCAWAPFGTVLGVFTIILLMRDSIKRLYERTAAATTA